MHFAKLSLMSPPAETTKASLEITTSFNDRPHSPIPPASSSLIPPRPPVKLHTTPISPLLTFTNLPSQQMGTRLPPVLDTKPESLVDENFVRSDSPNLLSWLPGLRRGRIEESAPIIIEEFPASIPMNAESANLSADVNLPTPVHPSTPPAEISLVDDPQHNPDSSPPRELLPQPPSDHYEPTSTRELNSSPSITQSPLQVISQDTYAAEPLIEVKQEPERQQTPSSPVHETSPAPQKVKTSFKDFLMRKKKEQVESPVISSPCIPTSAPTPGHASDPVINLSDEAGGVTKKVVEKQRAVSPEQLSGPPISEPPDGSMVDSSPVPEPEPVGLKPEIAQPPQLKLDRPSESWLLDPQILRPGVVVDLRQDPAQGWVNGEFVGVREVIESVVNLPGRPISAVFKSVDGKARRGIMRPVTTMVPVRPSEEGESVIILSGKHKGKVGRVINLGEVMVSVDLDGPETAVVNFEPPWLCLFFREDRGPLPNPTPPPPRVPPEKGDSMSPPPAPQSEDGEILQDPLPRNQSQQHGNTHYSQVTTPLRPASINPPTQPRSFQNTWKNNTSSIPSRSSQLVNVNPNGSVNNSSNLSNTFVNPPNRPSPPSGPKALRGLNPRSPYDSSRFKSGVVGSGLNGNGASGPPMMNGNGLGTGLKKELNPNNGHPGIPKGPSADRERERDRANGNWPAKNWGGGRR